MSQPKLRALIVEDEALVAMFIEDVLTDLGHEVVAVASRLEDGLKMASAAAIDFAILDVNLNGERSFPIAEALARRAVPFLFATGYGSAGVIDEWSHIPVLQKPFQQAELGAVIARALRARG